MSAYSEWKADLITDAEYATICRREAYEDEHDYYREPQEWDLFDDDDLMEVFEDDEIDEL